MSRLALSLGFAMCWSRAISSAVRGSGSSSSSSSSPSSSESSYSLKSLPSDSSSSLSAGIAPRSCCATAARAKIALRGEARLSCE